MEHRERLRLAGRLQQQWQRGLERQLEALTTLTDTIRPYLKRLQRAEQRWELAREHGFSLSEPMLQEQVRDQARSLRITLQDLETGHYPSRQEFTLSDFYQDLVQLEEEFPEVSVNWDTNQLMVVTDPIVLEDINLGPFCLRLNWNEWTIGQDLHSLEVIADEPNTAELNTEVTHPHVRSGELCSGDAQYALQKALQQGRLAEAFLLIRAVLSEYNPGSAYVKLENWHGTACNNCGSSVIDDDRSYCEACENDYCTYCCDNCGNCGACRCLGCLESCSACDERFCPGCLSTTVTEQSICRSCRVRCPKCREFYGPGDLSDETGLCENCDDEPIEESIDDDVSTATAATP
jgi:hypothetical protein